MSVTLGSTEPGKQKDFQICKGLVHVWWSCQEVTPFVYDLNILEIVTSILDLEDIPARHGREAI